MTLKKMVADDQVQNFYCDGFVVIPGMFSPDEMRNISAWVDEIANLPEVPGKYMMYFEQSLFEPGARIVSRIENFCPYHARLDQIVEGAQLLGGVSTLFGEPAVLFKDKINFKLPGGDGFKVHQDVQAGWDKYASLHITAMLSVDRSTLQNGCLEITPGHHARGFVGKQWEPIAQADEDSMKFQPCITASGDVIFFDSYAPHRSGPNLSNEPRRVLYLTCNRLSEGDQRARYYADKRNSYPLDCERETGKEYVFRV